MYDASAVRETVRSTWALSTSSPNVWNGTLSDFTGWSAPISGFTIDFKTNYTNVSAASPRANVITWYGVFWATIQWVIFFVGTFGNLLIVGVLIYERSKTHVAMQLFVGSLSAAGLASMFGSAWVQALMYIDNNWMFDKRSCQAQYFWQAEATYCHAWNLAAVAFERSELICQHS